MNTEKLEIRMLKDTATLESGLAVSLSVKHRFTYDPVIPLLGIYVREMKTYVHPTLYMKSKIIHNRQAGEKA